jgi:hypothetical protein
MVEGEFPKRLQLPRILGARPDYGGGWTSAKLDDGLGGA